MIRSILISVICVSSFMFGNVGVSKTIERDRNSTFHLDKDSKIPTLFVCDFYTVNKRGELIPFPTVLVRKLGLVCKVEPLQEKSLFRVCGKTGALCTRY